MTTALAPHPPLVVVDVRADRRGLPAGSVVVRIDAPQRTARPATQATPARHNRAQMSIDDEVALPAAESPR
jgi:hypothetical protein